MKCGWYGLLSQSVLVPMCCLVAQHLACGDSEGGVSGRRARMDPKPNYDSSLTSSDIITFTNGAFVHLTRHRNDPGFVTEAAFARSTATYSLPCPQSSKLRFLKIVDCISISAFVCNQVSPVVMTGRYNVII